MTETVQIVSNQILVKAYQKIRNRSLSLATPLHTEDYVPQPVHFASPPKWHLAHVTWFFEEFLLKRFHHDYRVFDKQYAFLFNSYYNTIGARTFRADRGAITRPSVDEVLAYRSYVDEQMILLISDRGDDTAFKSILEIGLNHEQQHQELFITDIKHTFSLNPLFPVYKEGGSMVEGQEVDDGWSYIEEGVYAIGHDGEGFCFDNESGRHKVYLQEAKLRKHLVSNGEYMEFIAAGGYSDFKYWLEEGWAWVNEQQATAPLYWYEEKAVWHHFTLGGYLPIDPEAILCHINYYEAEAFARWKGMRLPTEFEWEVAAPQLNWGQRWEWTGSAYLPYPGFNTAEGALGEYNGKFMVNQMVLRGASVATAPGHSRSAYRNFFHPHYQWQFSGIRLAKDV